MIGVLLEEVLGYPDADWGIALACHLQNIPLPEGVSPISFYCEKLGYSAEELYEIEGAFEGVPMVPGVRRVSMGREESVKSRLERVFWTLEKLDRQVTEEIAVPA